MNRTINPLTATKLRPTEPFPNVPTLTPDDVAHASRPSTKMLLAISLTGRHLYQGTVDPAVVARRRAKNRAARRARAAHRRAARR